MTNNTILCTIDGVEVNVKSGMTILEAAHEAGVFIPSLCHLQEIKPFASCFICVVEIEGGRGNLIPSCSTKVTPNMVITTNSDRVKASRRTCVELLLSDHLGDCHAPCMLACPAGIDIPGFLKYLSDGQHLGC